MNTLGVPESASKKRRNTYLNVKTGLLDKPMIYTYLRRHYILSKSIVVIADETYSSFFYQKLATEIIQTLL